MASSETVSDDFDELLLPDAAAWRAWLHEHHATERGVWLVTAKKGVTDPTELGRTGALEEALCYGWIDGQARRRDDATYRQRYTPRRATSAWSRLNVTIVARLEEAGRMHPAGRAEVERAKADGRWDRAYGSRDDEPVPDDLASALAAEPRAEAMFAILTRTNRTMLLHDVASAKRPDTRTRRIAKHVAMLADGETLYPQKATLPADEGEGTGEDKG
jgi:uncharacterized protein YdeI (YjbR/CyaY-like superfamily)